LTTGDHRYGVTLPFAGIPLGEHRDLLREVADLGYHEVWAGEANDLDAVTPLAAAAAWAPELRIGTSVVPVFTRGPGVLATTAAALSELAPGRVSFGVGSSSAMVVNDWNAGDYDRPYQRVRDTLTFLRQALAGGAVSEDYATFSVAGFRLGRPPVNPPELLVAALRPRMLELAATEADGAIATSVGPGDLAHLAVPFQRYGGRRLVAWVPVCPSTDAEAVRDAARPLLAAYLCVPAYAELHRWLGHGPALQPVWDAWAAGERRRAITSLPDRVIDDLVVHGHPAKCRDTIKEYFAGGATDVAMALSPLLGDPRTALRQLAPPG
jgi:probable F420-dependent oxidoreductase